MCLLLLLLEIVAGSTVKSPFGRVAVGSLDLTKTVRGRHAEKWVLGMGFLWIQSVYVSVKSIFTTYRLWM
jgi:hypothetical protein